MADSLTPDSDDRGRVNALHLFALSGFAVAQPLFDLLGHGAEFLSSHRAGPEEIIGLTALLLFGPPLLLAVPCWLVGVAAPAYGARLALALAGGLVTAIALPPLARAALPDALVLVGAFAVGGGAAFALTRSAILRRFVAWMAFAPLVFAAIFLYDARPQWPFEW